MERVPTIPTHTLAAAAMPSATASTTATNGNETPARVASPQVVCDLVPLSLAGDDDPVAATTTTTATTSSSSLAPPATHASTATSATRSPSPTSSPLVPPSNSAACASTRRSPEQAPATTDFTPRVILLTGGAGFIGSNCIVHLLRKYPHYRIICLDKMEYCAAMNNLNEVIHHPNFVFIKGDICSLDLVNHILKSEKVDTIMHFAAQTHVDNSFGLALDFTRTNVFGTHVLLESAKLFQSQIRRFIHVSTDEVYGESQMTDQRRLDESSNLNPTNPYAATKVAAEYLVKSYRQSFGLPTIITRGNNVYGPKQYPEKLIPKFIHLLDRRRPCPLHGDGQHLRSYLYVDDVSAAFDVILHRGVPGHIYNIGSDSEISNRDVLQLLLRKFGLEDVRDAAQQEEGIKCDECDRHPYVQYVRDRLYNDVRYFIDSSSLEALGWTRSVPFDEGLDRTIAWYHSHPNHWGDIGEGALAAHPTLEVKVGAEKE